MWTRNALALALVICLPATLAEAQEAEPEPSDPALEKVEQMLTDARAEIREFCEDGGEDDDPEHPGRRWAGELWKIRDEHPGTEASDLATTEAVHFMVHAGQAAESMRRAASVPPDDGAWSTLINIMFEAAGEVDDYEPFIRQDDKLDAYEFAPDKRALLRFKVIQAYWVMGDFERAHEAMRESKIAASSSE